MASLPKPFASAAPMTDTPEAKSHITSFHINDYRAQKSITWPWGGRRLKGKSFRRVAPRSDLWIGATAMKGALRGAPRPGGES